jgi:hypothetical protein
MTLADVFGGSAGGGAVDVDALEVDELIAYSKALEAERRRGEAEQARVMASIDRREVFRADGHSDVRGWYRATHRWSATEANTLRKLSRLGVAAPGVLDELAGGRLGRCQAAVLAKAYANPRVADALLETLDELFEHAANMQAWEFERVVDMWSKLVDGDGSFDDRERARDSRAATLGESDHTFVLRLFGPAVDGEHLRKRLQRYIDAEWKLDWARCVAEHGDDACPAKMARTGEQRRYDAFLRMIYDPNPPPAEPAEPVAEPDAEVADEPVDDIEVEVEVEVVDDVGGDEPAEPTVDESTTCSCGGKRRGWPESVTNLMIDIATFEHILDRLLRRTGDPPGGLLAGDGRPIPRPDDLRRWCSQTTDGRFIPPEDLVIEAILGRVRMVVTDERGVVLHMGRKRRLFTGALRDAIMLALTRCNHPGCLTRGSHSQADHIQPHSHGGPTDVNNGGIKCTTHNLLAYRLGFTTILDEHGYWHTYRPDGTEI